jgi:hypothetical protein
MDDNMTDTDSNVFRIENEPHESPEATQQRLDNMFSRDKAILQDNKPKMVIFGAMEQQPRTLYEILQPYVLKAVAKTSQAASFAG